MKKIILSLSILFTGFAAFAQCTPDATATLPYSPAGQLPDGVVNVPYSQSVTVVVRADTTIDTATLPIPGLPAGVYTLGIVKQEIDNIVGLPAGLSYACDNPSCLWSGGQRGCFNISGTPADTGSYTLQVQTSITVNILPFPGPTTLPAGLPVPFLLSITDPTSNEVAANQGFVLSPATPNPAANRTTVQFSSDVPKEVNISLYNATGKLVLSDAYRCNSGINLYSMPLSGLASGIYLLNVDNGSVVRQQKIVVE